MSFTKGCSLWRMTPNFITRSVMTTLIKRQRFAAVRRDRGSQYREVDRAARLAHAAVAHQDAHRLVRRLRLPTRRRDRLRDRPDLKNGRDVRVDPCQSRRIRQIGARRVGARDAVIRTGQIDDFRVRRIGRAVARCALRRRCRRWHSARSRGPCSRCRRRRYSPGAAAGRCRRTLDR